MTRNCRSKNVEACSLATSQAGESGKCKIIKPLLDFRETRTCFQQLLCHETPIHPFCHLNNSISTVSKGYLLEQPSIFL
jgi:hypothetical protein